MKRHSNELAPLAVEVLRSNDIEPQLPRTQAQLIKILVQQGIAEALAARDEFVFEPFFRTRQMAYEIKRLQTVPERKKWGIFFERRGCLSCHTKDKPHASNGLCSLCHGQVFRILKEILSELMQEPAQ